MQNKILDEEQDNANLSDEIKSPFGGEKAEPRSLKYYSHE